MFTLEIGDMLTVGRWATSYAMTTMGMAILASMLAVMGHYLAKMIDSSRYRSRLKRDVISYGPWIYGFSFNVAAFVMAFILIKSVIDGGQIESNIKCILDVIHIYLWTSIGMFAPKLIVKKLSKKSA